MGCEFAGIVSIAEYFEISYAKDRRARNVNYTSFADLAQRANVPLVEIDIMEVTPLFDTLAGWQPGLGVAVGWYYMLGDMIRRLFPLGCVGLHASLLPKYRGGAPLTWALINQEQETGVSLFHLADGVDDGDIVGQKKFAIAPRDTIATLLEKTERSSIELLREYVPGLLDGTAPRSPQDESLATVVPQRSPEDGEIDWSWPSDRIDAFIRAQTRPYPGAWTMIGGKKVTIWDAAVEDVQDGSR